LDNDKNGCQSNGLRQRQKIMVFVSFVLNPGNLS